MPDRKEVLEKMLINEEAVFERLVDKANRVFKVDRSGNIIWMVPASKLTDKQKVAMAVLARYFAAELELAESEIITNAQVANLLGMHSMSVGARLAELRNENIVHQDGKGKHRVSLVAVERVLDEILER